MKPFEHRDDVRIATTDDVAMLEGHTGEHFGAGMEIVGDAVYPTPRPPGHGLVGVLMGIDEIRDAHEDIEGRLDAHYLPFNDDSSGDFLVVGHDGVFRYLHDKPSDRNLYRIAPTFEDWVLSIREE